MASKPNLKIFSGRGSRYLAEKIAAKYGQELGKVNFIDYSDGEMQPSFDESVRGAYVYLVQSSFMPIENLFELLLMIDAAYRASAYKVIAVIPYYGYGRQDRKDKPRVAIGAKLIANMLAAAGVSRVMTMDLHADQIQGFFDVPVDHLFASSIFVPYIRNLNLDNLVMASPDMGGTKRANAYANHMHTSLVVCHKSRTKPNEIADMKIIGDVEGKNVIILDDIVDTAGTLTKAAKLMIDNGANSVRAAITHPVLSGNAIEKIDKSALSELIVTDSIPLKQECDKITVLSVADMFAKVMHQIYENNSISDGFIL
ncbi:MAG: ribose-phosphate pyrophosphokinase [Bacteroidales bacterium]|nr:ribose-phosphate pyrophosphokinase [Bacteroidales bacterium]